MFKMIQKVNPKILPSDICQPSLNWLENYVHQWFERNIPNHGKIWFSDENSIGLSTNFPNQENDVEIILTGSFLLRILESKLWPFKRCRIWVLSARIKKILTTTLKVPEHLIGVITRDNLVSNSSFLNFSGPINLVYAGRISFAKNITGLLKLVSCLQVEHNCHVSLDIFGETDNLHDDSLGRYNPYTMDQLIKSEVRELGWTSPPVFHGKVNSETWLSFSKEVPVFVSLSTSMYEDFGVAAEEARLKGWPCLLSDWGGHQECLGSYLIPYSRIPQTREPNFIQNIKASKLANYIVSAKVDNSIEPISLTHIPRFISHLELQAISDNIIKSWGSEILLCLREKMDFFADTIKGMELFDSYHQGMGKLQTKAAVIVNDLKTNPKSMNITIDDNFDVLYTREIFCKHIVLKLNEYNTFYLCGLESELETVKSFILNIVGDQVDIFTFPSESFEEFST